MLDSKDTPNVQPMLNDEEIKRQWQYLRRSLIEFKSMSDKLIVSAVMLKNFNIYILDSAQNGLNDVEEDLLKELLVHFQNISECTNLFPEIGFEQNDEANPEMIYSMFQKLEWNINHNALSPIFNVCAFITLNYEKLYSIIQRNSIASPMINLSVLPFVQYLTRLSLFSSQWLESFRALRLTCTSMEVLDTIFKNVPYALNIVLNLKNENITLHECNWSKFFAALNLLGATELNLSCVASDQWYIFCKELGKTNIAQLTVDRNLDEMGVNQLKEILIQNQNRVDIESYNSLSKMAARVAAPFYASEKIQSILGDDLKEKIQDAKSSSSYLSISGGSKILFFSPSFQCSESINHHITELQNEIDKYFSQDEDCFVISIILDKSEMQITFNSQTTAERFREICLEKYQLNLNLPEKRTIKLDDRYEIEFFIENVCGVAINDNHLKCLGFEKISTEKPTCPIQ